MRLTQLERGMKVMATENEKKPKLQAGQVLDLVKLVEYGEGAVVSRTLVENNAGTVTLFAFALSSAAAFGLGSQAFGSSVRLRRISLSLLFRFFMEKKLKESICPLRRRVARREG